MKVNYETEFATSIEKLSLRSCPANSDNEGDFSVERFLRHKQQLNGCWENLFELNTPEKFHYGIHSGLLEHNVVQSDSNKDL